jgi:hypothetical protein
MEDVLDVYQRPYDPKRPQVCLDEASLQLLCDARAPLPLEPGQVERFDSEYVREGTRNLFLVFEPLAGWRHVEVTERRTRIEFAHVVRYLVDVRYADAERVVLVLDQLNTHSLASLYQAFPPEEAKRLAQRVEIHHTPKHGSWLNMAEIELSVLARQCLADRMQSPTHLQQQVAAWDERRNRSTVRVDWRFTTADARIRLKRLYPSVQA